MVPITDGCLILLVLCQLYEMKPFHSPEWTVTITGTDDPLAPYRIRAMYLFAIVGIVFLLPFAISHFVQGNHVLATVDLGIVLALGIDAIAIRRNKTPPVPYALLILPAVVAIGLAVKTLGVVGTFWCFPAVLFFYFAVPRRMANVCNLMLLIAATVMMYRYTGHSETVRFAVTLTVTIVVTNIILNIIQDLQRKLVDQAITDPLTGAFNRRHLDSRLGETIERSITSSASTIVLGMRPATRY